jgi:hypothetical protein
MTLLPESERTYQEWRRLVVQHSVTGVKVHDARLAAAMIVHGVTHLLTLNTDDFTRYEGIVAVHHPRAWDMRLRPPKPAKRKKNNASLRSGFGVRGVT